MPSPLRDPSVPATASSPITRVLITGAHGQLGAAMVRAFAGLEVTAHTRSSARCHRCRGREPGRDNVAAPHLIVNCAAFNDVDGAEDRAVEALAVNAFAVRNLARPRRTAGARFVHYSTDFVFDGSASAPYTEDTDRRRAARMPSRSCWANGLRSRRRTAYVLRVESLFGAPANWTGRRGTLDGIVAQSRAGARGPRIHRSHRLTGLRRGHRRGHAAPAISDAAPGLYHCVNTGHATWYEVAREVAALVGNRQPNLVPVTMDQLKLKAPRPRYCALSVDKLAAAGFAMPAWQDALRRWLATRSALTT